MLCFVNGSRLELLLACCLLAIASARYNVNFEISNIPHSWSKGFTVEVYLEDTVEAESASERFVIPLASIRLTKEKRSCFIVEHPKMHTYVRIKIIGPSLTGSKLSKIGRSAIELGTSRILLTRLLNPEGLFYFETSRLHDHSIVLGPDLAPTRFHTWQTHNALHEYRPRPYRRILMLTRGTRGDVQPFVTAARQLASRYGFHVTICTESPFQSFIERNSVVARGSIEFAPSGGDTSTRIQYTPAAKMFMDAKSSAVQAVILSRMELEFFASESVMHDLADHLRPDVIIYGFTMTSVATLISDSLQIPIVGLILQPTVLPSRHHCPIIPIPGNGDEAWSADLVAHPWGHLIQQRSPMVVPIPECAFGCRPDDWCPAIQMSDFLFLDDDCQTTLSSELEDFLSADAGRFVLAMSFSSMPVSKAKMDEIIISISGGKTRPRIIVVGKARTDDGASSKDVDDRMADLRKAKLLLEVSSAPFHLLFPRVSAAVIHGGLGTTAEAMRAGLPVIVTGTLLLDQRFWGDKIHELGIGPKALHIDQFQKSAAAVIDELFCAENFSQYKRSANELREKVNRPAENGTISTLCALKAAIDIARPVNVVPMKLRPVTTTECTTFVGRAFTGFASCTFKFLSGR